MSVNLFNDGGKSYGSETLVIKKFDAVTSPYYVPRDTYLTDDISITQETNVKLFTDKDDIPNGQIISRGEMTGKATCQFLTSTTQNIEIGDIFKLANLNDPATPFYFVVNSVERAESKGEETKQPIGFRKILNPTAEITDTTGAKKTVTFASLTFP